MTLNLAERIQEDHLTCKICFENFKKPKALGCLHTFCEGCIRDYVVSRSFDIAGKFPCPICRLEIEIPKEGVAGFRDNHLIASLLDTVQQNQVNPCLSTETTQTTDVTLTDPASPSNLLNIPNISPTRIRSLSANDLSSTHHISGAGDAQLQYASTAVSSSTSHLASPSQPTRPFVIQTDTSPIEYPQIPYDINSYVNIDEERNNVETTITITESFETMQDVANTKLCFGQYGPGLSDLLKPKGLAVAPSGEIIISDMGGNRILIFSTEGRLIRRFICDCKVHDVAITDKGNILVVVHGSKVAKSIIMKEFTFSGKIVGSYGSNFHHDNPSGLSISADNSIVITSIENNQVYVFNKDKKLQRLFGKKGIGDDRFISPYHVATNGKGEIIVSDYGNSAIKIFDKLGNFKLKFGGEGTDHNKLSKPLGVACDSSNYIYIADSGNNRVEVFSHKGKYLTTLLNDTDKIHPGAKPMNIALTSTNDIAVLLTGDKFAHVRVYAALSTLPQAEDQPSAKKYFGSFMKKIPGVSNFWG